MKRSLLDVVVGLDGSPESTTAARWAAAVLAPGGRLHAVHVVHPVEELAVDAVLADSVTMVHHRERELREEWLAPLVDELVEIRAVVIEGPVADTLLAVGQEVDAQAIVVGHHPHPRFGPRLVGRTTVELLHRADRTVVVVPDRWDQESAAGLPVVVGVGVSHGTRAALRWAIDVAPGTDGGLSLVHARGPRSVFRPDGLLDVLAYHLDPSVIPSWVEADLMALAEEIRDASGVDVDLQLVVEPGRIGPSLVEAGDGAQLLVIGRGEPPFIRRHAIAPYLRHALAHASCPVAVVPADEVT